MKIQWKKLIVCLAVPLAVGGLSALLTRGSMETFEAIAKPPLAPPGLAVPGGLDGAVCSDGNRVLSGADFRKAERACAVRIRCAAFAQLFLAIVLLQYAGVSVLVRLARAAVAAHSGCNRVVFPNFKAGGVPDDPLFTMGGVRGIFEPFDISAELR